VDSSHLVLQDTAKAGEAFEASLSPAHIGEDPDMSLSLVSAMEQGHYSKQTMDLHRHLAPTPENNV
jgi:hypothetical protein